MKMKQSVPKRRHIKFRRRGITQKKNIQHREHGESLKSRIIMLAFLSSIHFLFSKCTSQQPRYTSNFQNIHAPLHGNCRPSFVCSYSKSSVNFIHFCIEIWSSYTTVHAQCSHVSSTSARTTHRTNCLYITCAMLS